MRNAKQDFFGDDVEFEAPAQEPQRGRSFLKNNRPVARDNADEEELLRNLITAQIAYTNAVARRVATEVASQYNQPQVTNNTPAIPLHQLIAALGINNPHQAESSVPLKRPYHRKAPQQDITPVSYAPRVKRKYTRRTTKVAKKQRKSY